MGTSTTGTDIQHKRHDKVRIKEGPYAGQRGMIRDLVDGGMIVVLDEDGSAVLVRMDAVQNYSLAARKAWMTNSHREGIGGRKPTGTRPRQPVAFRVDPLVWDLLQEAEKRGLITTRTEAINHWILAGVTALLRDAQPVERVEEQADMPSPAVISLFSKGQ